MSLKSIVTLHYSILCITVNLYWVLLPWCMREAQTIGKKEQLACCQTTEKVLSWYQNPTFRSSVHAPNLFRKNTTLHYLHQTLISTTPCCLNIKNLLLNIDLGEGKLYSKQNILSFMIHFKILPYHCLKIILDLLFFLSCKVDNIVLRTQIAFLSCVFCLPVEAGLCVSWILSAI